MPGFDWCGLANKPTRSTVAAALKSWRAETLGFEVTCRLNKGLQDVTKRPDVALNYILEYLRIVCPDIPMHSRHDLHKRDEKRDENHEM
jgi:hypothetical protein